MIAPSSSWSRKGSVSYRRTIIRGSLRGRAHRDSRLPKTFAHHQQYVDDVVRVDDGALRGAMRFLLDRMKLVAEPSGAITVAALLEGLVKPRGKTVAVLSGGNIEWDGLVPLLSGSNQ